MARESSDADILCNRAALAHAQLQQLMSSWLPPKKKEPATKDNEEALESDEPEAFAPVPEFLGLGASVPEYGYEYPGRTGTQISYSDDKLRSRMLGKRARGGNNQKYSGSIHSHTRPPRRKQPEEHEDSSAGEEGRTAIRRRNDKALVRAFNPEPSKKALAQASLPQKVASVELSTYDAKAATKGSNSYLDEVLLKRSEKRKKRKAKLRGGIDISTEMRK